MKVLFKRALPASVLALILIFSLAFAGCDQIIGKISGAFTKPSATPVLSETPMPPATPSASPVALATPDAGKWSEWVADAQKKLPKLIPLSVAFSSPEYLEPSVSGDGKYVLFRHIAPTGSDDIVVRNMQTGMETVVPFPKGIQGIPYFMWSGDSRHVLFMIDNSGDENYALYSVDISSGESKTLYRKTGVTARIVALDDSDPNVLYFASNGRDARFFDLYRCDIAAGTSELMLQNDGSIIAWYFDRTGALRIIETMDGNGGEHLLLKTGNTGGTEFKQSDWKDIVDWAYEDTTSSGLLFISVDGKSIYYTDSSGRNTVAVMKMDLATGATSLIFCNPDYDVSSAWLDLKMDTVTAAAVNSDRSRWVTLEEGIEKQFKYVQSLVDGDFDFTSSSSDDRYWIVSFDSDTEGRSYYYVDSQTLTSTLLFRESPELKNYQFAKMEPIKYTSSDGLTVRGYATFPVGLERRDLPMVLLVHGGPQARDVWGYMDEVQWLANRGYMVLQVNFRGSTGYGKAFNKAGDREWGGKMQQDLTDAVNWAVEKGYADKSRIAIMGGSYGGYAALAGAAFTPDLYACAVDMFGPSSLITLINNSPAYWEAQKNQMYQSIGNPQTDGAFMKSRSPLYSVDKIKIPILIAQGGNDVRVTRQESEQIVQAMRQRGLYVDYRYFPEAGHGFNTEADAIQFYTEAENFLAAYIGGRTESAGN